MERRSTQSYRPLRPLVQLTGRGLLAVIYDPFPSPQLIGPLGGWLSHYENLGESMVTGCSELVTELPYLRYEPSYALW